jgi:hypothetical protein
VRARVAALPVALALLVAGCGGGGKGAGTTATSSVSSPWVASGEYTTALQNALAAASTRVEAELVRPGAPRLAAAVKALQQASRRLGGLKAPANARTGNALVARGLDQWASQLPSDAAAYARCAGPSAPGPALVEQGFRSLEGAGYILRQRSRRGLGECRKPQAPMAKSAYLAVVNRELAVSGPTIDAALGAGTPQQLDTLVAKAKRALRAAASRLDSLEPPPAAAGANDLLVLGLDEWASEVQLAAEVMFSHQSETIVSVANAMRGPGTLQRAARELHRAGFRVALAGSSPTKKPG